MVNPAELIKLADEIDSRLGPIPGRTADRIAVVLRKIAESDTSHMASAGQAFQALAPTAPLPWDRHHNRPSVIVDALGCEVCRINGDEDEAAQIVGMILCAVNTCGGFKAYYLAPARQPTTRC